MMLLVWDVSLGIAQITQNTAVKAINPYMLSFIKHPS
jgi:hypothetical protein